VPLDAGEGAGLAAKKFRIPHGRQISE